MKRHVRLLFGTTVLVPLILGALALTPASASISRGSAAATAFTVRSSLDGKSVLPRRIRWLAIPSLPASKVARVDFLIDGGSVRWTERSAPYSYADDGAYPSPPGSRLAGTGSRSGQPRRMAASRPTPSSLASRRRSRRPRRSPGPGSG